jgi:hypothetical protein
LIFTKTSWSRFQTLLLAKTDFLACQNFTNKWKLECVGFH